MSEKQLPEASDGEAEGTDPPQDPEAEVRSTGEPEVSGPRSGSRRKRKGKSDAAVPQGSDQQVDEGQDPRSSEPTAEAALTKPCIEIPCEGWQEFTLGDQSAEAEVESEAVHIHIGGATAYTDHPAIPQRFERDFKLHVLKDRYAKSAILHPSVNPDVYDGELVSNTIRDLKIWEVPETIIMLSAFKAADVENTVFLDIGCHAGWFSLLAMSYGIPTIAVDGDDRMIELLERSAETNRYANYVLVPTFIDEGWAFPLSPAPKNLIVKMDIEGSERYAVAALWDHFESGRISHCVMEVSPVFESDYADLLEPIFKLGYRCQVMPPKTPVPPVVEDIPHWLLRSSQRIDQFRQGYLKTWVNRQHQFDVVLYREDAQWG